MSYIQVYTGNGKGKTTAALGLAIRALGAGFRVFLGQFLKKGLYNEIKILQKFVPQIEIQQFGTGCFIKKEPSKEDIKKAQEGWKKSLYILSSKDFDLVILDELTLALYFGLLEENKVLEALKERTPSIEVVITGRYASPKLLEIADLVTEMKEIKHYYQKGILARKGIEK